MNAIKIKTNKKRIIYSVILFTILLFIIMLNYKAFIVDNVFNYMFFSISIVSCLVACCFISIELELNNKLNLLFTVLTFIISILFSYIIIELLNQNSLFSIYTKRLIFNFIVIIFLHLFIYAITNKISFTIILSNSLIFILGVVNYTVTCFRGTPIVPWDILSIKTAAYVATSYTFEFNYFLLVATSLFVFIIALATKLKYKYKKEKVNLAVRFACISFVTILTIVFYKTDVIDYFDFENNLWKPKDEYANNGFLASFVKQSKNLFNDKPGNYSYDSVESILVEVENKIYENNHINAYDATINSEDNPNIIVIMSESFSDLSVNGEFNTSEEYMPFFKSLKENTIRGNTYVSVFGGQTPNSEWEFLTNNSMAFMPYRTVPYQQYIRRKSYSLATTLKAQGYTSSAIHPWYGSGYRRNAIYPLLGFDYFESIETLDNLDYLRVYPTDLSTYKQIVKQFEKKEKDEKIFNFTVTMQNHSGYDLEGYESTLFLEDIENCPRVEQYLSVMKESDKALEYLIDYFKNYDEKTIILLFGDHQPPYLEDEFWNTIMEDPNNETSKYITPFIIWANYDIEEEYVDMVSLNYLSTLLVDTANLKTTPYMEFLKQIREVIPVITGNGYIDEFDNYYTFEHENEFSDILRKYQLVQYNNVFDNKNRIDRFFKIAE